MRNADIIFVLKNGELIAQGQHHELLENCEYYNELVNSKEFDSTLREQNNGFSPHIKNHSP